MQKRSGNCGSEEGDSSDGRENLRRYVGSFWLRRNTQETSAAFLNLENANIGKQIQIGKGFIGRRWWWWRCVAL